MNKFPWRFHLTLYRKRRRNLSFSFSLSFYCHESKRLHQGWQSSKVAKLLTKFRIKYNLMLLLRSKAVKTRYLRITLGCLATQRLADAAVAIKIKSGDSSFLQRRKKDISLRIIIKLDALGCSLLLFFLWKKVCLRPVAIDVHKNQKQMTQKTWRRQVAAFASIS